MFGQKVCGLVTFSKAMKDLDLYESLKDVVDVMKDCTKFPRNLPDTLQGIDDCKVVTFNDDFGKMKLMSFVDSREKSQCLSFYSTARTTTLSGNGHHPPILKPKCIQNYYI